MATDPILPLKHQLAREIVALSRNQAITVGARRLGIDPARFCDLRHGRVARFSVERLIRILGTIDRRVTMTIVCDGPSEICWIPQLRAQSRVLGQQRLGRVERRCRKLVPQAVSTCWRRRSG